MRGEIEYIGNNDEIADKFESRSGICTNCRHHSTCTFPGSPDKPKLFCEEFECLGASCSEVESDLGAISARPAEVLIEQSASESDVCKYVGLCVNCDHRESCTLPKPAGGIWYCEEYR